MKNHRPRLLSPRILAPLMALSFSPLAQIGRAHV